MTVDRVVIVGAGQAGFWAASTLRAEGYEGAITLVGDEAHTPYERPPLSKEILVGSAPADSAELASSDELAALSVDTRLGTRVAGIERECMRVVLDGGVPGQAEFLPYDALVLCTGGRARRLPAYDTGSACIHTLRSLDDALRLRRVLTRSGGRLLIIGGGWIGLEVAASARELGCDVIVVEAAQRLCKRSVSEDVSSILSSLHDAHGVRLVLGTAVDALTPTADGSTFDAALSSGVVVGGVSHVVVAAGMVANDELASDAGLLCRNGVVVDSACRSSDPHIYAAGDVAVMHTANGAELRLESWQNAQDQGMAAARAILGQNVDYRPIPMNWSQQYDRFFQIAGYANDASLSVARDVPTGILRFYLDDDRRVLGAVGVNAGREWRFARKLVESRARVSVEALADTGRPLKEAASHAAA